MPAALIDLTTTGAVWSAAHSTHQSSLTGISLGIEAIDAALPNAGLKIGALHEWVALPSPIATKSNKLLAPLTLLSEIARRAHALCGCSERKIIWIDRRFWPSPAVLKDLTAHSLFIDPPAGKSTTWTLDTTVRSPASAVVIAPLENFTPAFTRRLALAAAHSNVLALLIIDPKKAHLPTSAATRWAIRPIAPSHVAQTTQVPVTTFELELLKVRAALPACTRWLCECRYNENQTIHFSVLSALVDRNSDQKNNNIKSDYASCA